MHLFHLLTYPSFLRLIVGNMRKKNYLHASRCLQGLSGQILAVPQLIVTHSLVREFLRPGIRTGTDYLKLVLCFLLFNGPSAFASFSFQALTKVSPLKGEFLPVPHDCLEWLGYVRKEAIKSSLVAQNFVSLLCKSKVV